MLQSSINNCMTYTIVLTKEQKDLVCKAMEKFSQLYVGQTTEEREAAGKLAPKLIKAYKDSTTDLTNQA